MSDTRLIITDEFANQAKYKKQPNWGFNGLGYIVYKRTYARVKESGDTEEWNETVQRCINGAQKIGAQYTQAEAERLFDYVFNLKCNFAGRMLWQLGTSTVDRFGANSLLNCWFASMNEPKAFLFLFENLMLGGGVGYSIRREDVHELPKIKKDVKILHQATKDADFIVPDSREGWVKLLEHVLNAFYATGKSFTYSTILIRGAGEQINGFGGKASGPQILVDGMAKIVSIFHSREGKKLRSIDVLDVCNIIGSIVVAGNVRRCLPEGAMVHSESGLIPIQNIKVGDNVLTSYGYRKVNNLFNQGVQGTIIIKTQDGEFECTPNHKMAVLNSTEEYVWVPASELKSGDRLISTRRLIHGSKQSLPSWIYEKPANSTTCQDITIPELDNDMAWFIGLFHGDGYAYANKKDNGFNAYVSLVFGENEYEIAEKAKAQLERFGVNNVVLKHRKDENSWQVSCVSKQLAYYFHDNIKQPKTEIRVPEFINNAEYDIRLSYVCGVFDSDGCSKHRPVNIVTTVYENFAKDIQNLLYSCGIESRFERGGDPLSRIGWQQLFKVNLITNYSKYKISQSGFSLKEMLIGSRAQNSNSYPPSWIEHHRRETGASSDQNVTVDTYARYSQLPQEFIPVEVISISSGRNVKTYDIEVDEVHEFYCNGYLTHNSAEIALGDPDDILYLRAKNWSSGNVPNWRAMSNNTLYVDDYSHLMDEFWTNGYEINKDTGFANGEPYGFFNLPLSQKYGRTSDGLMKDSNLYPTDSDNVVGTNPCGEISLSNYECCNLCELYLNNITTKEELIDCAKLLYKSQKAIAALPFLHEETNKIVHKNMRLGLGVTGVCQSLNKVDWLDDCYIALRKFDKQWSKERGWSESVKLTTVKPSGTLSLLGGATPGVHPAYSKYYMRTVRMSSSDKLVQICRDLGYHTEFLLNFDGTENRDTIVVYFPCETPESAILADNMDVIKQLEMVKKLQSVWSDNAVSVTAYYSPEELGKLKDWLKENYKEHLKSVSFLLRQKHGFKQAPYQEIDKDTYEKHKAKVKPLSSVSYIISGDVLQGIECEGGVCPIR